MKIKLLLAVWFCTLCSAVVYGAAYSTQTIMVAGQKREFLLQLPPEEASKPYPLAVVLHGGGGKAKRIARNPQFSELPSRKGAIVAYPEAIDGAWNVAGLPRSNGSLPTQDDVSFISRLIETILQKHDGDPTRVLVTGASRGGFMTYYLSQEIPEQITAAAPIIACLPEILVPRIHRAMGISTIILLGTKDPLIPYEGGEAGMMSRKIRNKLAAQGHNLCTISARETVRLYRKINRLGNRPIRVKIADRADDACISEEIRYMNENGVEITLVKTFGGGHGIPGQLQYLPKKVIGVVTKDFDAMDVIWPFFMRATQRQ
jgi:polyhydroxybutyrate depolymerase